jgi:hypothetical protein
LNYSILEGNPLSAIARQIGLTLIPIAHKTNLYDIDGKMVSRGKDEVIEQEFNSLLEACASIAHQHRVRTIDSRPLSLGHTLDTLLAFVFCSHTNTLVHYSLQQRRVSMRRMEHLLTIEKGLDRSLNIVHQLDQLSSAIASESAALDRLDSTGVDDKMTTEADIDARLAYRARVIQLNRRIQAHHDLFVELSSLQRDIKDNEKAPPAYV